jgi:PTS system galactitol-specific IIA component
MSARPVIAADLILPQLQAPDWQTAIRMLGERLEAGGYVRETYVTAVLEREAVYPTGLPLGHIDVAIPHTDTVHVVTPGIAIATLATPVAFGQMGSPEEKVAARIVFLLAMKDPRAQVSLLQNLVALFQKEAVLRRLTETDDPAVIAQIMTTELQVQEVV